jgi:hypothetical protein
VSVKSGEIWKEDISQVIVSPYGGPSHESLVVLIQLWLKSTREWLQLTQQAA